VVDRPAAAADQVELHRLAGPPGEPVLCPVDDD
jgi:hypothetical protein